MIKTKLIKREDGVGGTVYPGLFTDDEGRTWNILIREGGSVSLYCTAPEMRGCVGVAFDTIGIPLNDLSRDVVAVLADMVEGINALLTAAGVANLPDAAIDTRRFSDS